MGAETFSQRARGKTASEAFYNAVETAQYDHGHAGYSGTIAEKDSFIDLTSKVHPDTLQTIKARGWFDYISDDPLWNEVDEKWGPAGCIALGDDGTGESVFLFFGWASS